MSNEYSLPIFAGVGGIGDSSAEEAEKLYEAYPRKKARPVAIRAILSALKKAPFSELMTAVNKFARDSAGTQPKYIPHPATWFNQERWKDSLDKKQSGGYFSV